MIEKVNNQIINKINLARKGSIFFPADFQNLGSSEAVRKALSRLEKDGSLKRIAKGIYFKPEIDSTLGLIYPSMEDIAKAIAKRDKARVLPTGNYALNRLGLSTQIPLKIIYLTDGSPRNVSLGDRTISFKKASPKKLSLMGPISSLIIQALQELGQQGITENIRQRLKELLAREKPENIKHDTSLAPAWIRSLLNTLQFKTI